MLCTICNSVEIEMVRPDWMTDSSWDSLVKSAVCDSCGAKEKLKQRAQEQKNRATESFVARLAQSNLERYRMDFDLKHPKANMPLFCWFKDRHTTNGLFVSGMSGLGKSRLTQHFLYKILQHTELTAYYTTAADLADEITRESKSERSKDAFMSRLKRYDILVIDDLGKESTTEAKRSAFFQIIDARYTAWQIYQSGRVPYNGYRLWVTTQMTSKELIDMYGESDGEALVRRILESCQIYSAPKKRVS